MGPVLKLIAETKETPALKQTNFDVLKLLHVAARLEGIKRKICVIHDHP